MATTTPKAQSGVRALKERLSGENPGFAAALEAGARAEALCRSVREELRSRRKQKKLEQAELAERLDMTQSAVSKVEGGSGDLGLKTVYRFAEALGFRPIVLLVPSHRSLPEWRVRKTTRGGARAISAPGKDEVPAVEEVAAIELTESKLLRQMSFSISEAMGNLVKK